MAAGLQIERPKKERENGNSKGCFDPMKPLHHRHRWLMAVLSAAILGASLGCSSEGDQGPAGADGSSDPAPIDTVLDKTQDVPGVVVRITGLYGASGADGTFQVGDRIEVEFTVKMDDGTDIPIDELDFLGILVSGPTFNYQRVIAEVDDVIDAAVAGSGHSYTYTLPAIPERYLPPFNDSASFGSGDGELSGQDLLAGTYTVGITARKDYTVTGSVQVDAGNDTEDFLFGGATTLEHREVVTRAHCNQCHRDFRVHDETRRELTLCVLCHTSGAEDENDGSVEGGTPGVSIDLRVMIHKIHSGWSLPSVVGVATLTDGSGDRDYSPAAGSYKLVGDDGATIKDFSSVVYPVWPSLDRPMPRNLGYSALASSAKTKDDTVRKGVVACDKCHGDPDGSGPITTPAQASLTRVQPTRRACGSCHDDVNWDYPYRKNGQTMPAQANDAHCAQSGCHGPGEPLSVDTVHLHPLKDPALSPGVVFDITAVSGGTGAGGKFQAGDSLSLTFTLKDGSGNDLALESLDSTSATMVGPNENRQFVLPSVSINSFDFAGRLATATTTNKATMSKAIGAAVAETLTVQFSSATAFTVTGSTSGALGASALPASPSTNPSSSSLAAIKLTTGAVAQTITVAFSSATAFAVSGSVSGAMGSGSLPASTSASTRFTSTDGTVAFNLSVSTTPFASGNNIYLTVFKGAVANPVLFAVVAGRSSVAANDRIYYEVVPAASSYTITLPMDLSLEFLGDGDGNIGQALAAANTPVYYGRQTLFERTALPGAATTLAADAGGGDRSVDVDDVLAATLVANDYVVLEDGVAGKEEYLRVSSIDTTNKRIWMTAPLRYAHSSGAAFQEATLTYRQEGVHYSLTPGTGTVTSLVAFGAGNGLVMNYRTDAAFGWKRDAADAIQATYFSPPGDAVDFDETWGEWKGLSFLDGTYSVGMWGYRNLDLGLQNEVQTYRITSEAATSNFLYGSATEVVPRAAISSPANCNRCHNDVYFHGGSRRGLDTCLFCHGESGAQLPPTPTEAGTTIEFRSFLHKVHRGGELELAGDFLDGDFQDVVFPAMSGGVKNCSMCHGQSDAWKEPAARDHQDQSLPTRVWRTACNSCHDGSDASAHIDIMTSGAGVESCGVCHESGAEFAVEVMHMTR